MGRFPDKTTNLANVHICLKQLELSVIARQHVSCCLAITDSFYSLIHFFVVFLGLRVLYIMFHVFMWLTV